MQHKILLTVTSAVFCIAVGTLSAQAAGGAGEPGEGYVPPYELEPIDDGKVVRITLIEKAADRLGIETAEVATEKADRSFLIGGNVLAEPPKAMAKSASSNQVASTSPVVSQSLWIALPITEAIEGSKDLPIKVRALNGASGVEAIPDKSLNDTVTAEGGGILYYKTSGDVGDLEPGRRVLVEVPFAGNDKEHKVVPFAAIIYDHHGDEWVYVSPEPLVYQREAIDIAYVEAEKAFLNEGPDVGTEVVVVGAAELLGTEQRVGH